ncbi:hypothetical protein A2215_04235 [Candidatus Berkelbacteria bacterium RIFOXYA2_FULL_43_10]|uniref:Uncharacterized protein n=1 Tax=Candidatus Berkelbacteria bacterium RIFOXYA2_FULL_43_10 TaxID=1797472 RepID=A0A1F5EA13_9BACT|nr:MAG: hypothetical protein A2215_04235 [Candidatus Berkelbacteria bacterium RIFOXYA2_FULL_43_10]
MCPFCGREYVRFAQKRGTHRCHYCDVLDATPEEYKRWSQPDLPLDEDEIALALRATHPQPIIVKRLLATLEEARASQSQS